MTLNGHGGGGPDVEQLILGRVIQALHTHTMKISPVFNANVSAGKGWTKIASRLRSGQSGEGTALPQNLLEATWTDLDSDELRVLLQHRFGNTLGQYDGDDGKLYLPAAGGQSRIALTFEGTKIATVEPGAAFDANEWEGMHREIEDSLLAGVPKIGRDYSFSSLPVQGSWRGARSGVQLIPAPTGAPRYGGADDPFILEFPIKGSDLLFITNHRRLREHRKFTLLLNLLLKGG